LKTQIKAKVGLLSTFNCGATRNPLFTVQSKDLRSKRTCGEKIGFDQKCAFSSFKAHVTLKMKQRVTAPNCIINLVAEDLKLITPKCQKVFEKDESSPQSQKHRT
jgi:hypothetical protein